MSSPAEIILKNVRHCQGVVILPGSKSIANRALLMAALCAQGQRTVLTNVLRSDDTERMITALQALGVSLDIDPNEPTTITVHGCAGQWPQQPRQLDLGNAGTAMRPLLAVLSATWQGPTLELTGDARMQERPLLALVDCLQQHGAQLRCTKQWGYPPIQLSGGLQGGTLSIDGSASSQYISALLMALPLLPQDSVLQLVGDVVSRPYIHLTIAMLARFGIEIDVHPHHFVIRGGQSYQSPQHYWVEGDASAASYWLAAAAIAGGPLLVRGVGKLSIQGDVAFADYLAQMGAQVTVADDYIEVKGGSLRALDADYNAIPDAAMTMATVALFAQGTTHIRNVANWRIKETDRLAAMATELAKVGAEVVTTDSSIHITPPLQIQHAVIETYQDHRMAMCFALLGFSEAGVTIRDPNCCAKTYPNFFTEFRRLTAGH